LFEHRLIYGQEYLKTYSVLKTKKMVVIPDNFIYIFPAVYGLIVGLVELFFVHADESGLGWLRHGLHALPWCFVFTYVSMNTWVVASYFPFEVPGWLLFYAVPIVLGIITTFKVKAAAAIARGGSVGEKFIHALIIGILVALAPFVYWAIGMANIEFLSFIMR